MFSSNATQVSSANYIEDVFSTYLYTGNGSTQTITNGIDLSGKGGLVWIKSRSSVASHLLTDSGQGISKRLSSNSTAAAQPNFEFTSWNSNGFSLDAGQGFANTNAVTYASWTFREQPKFFDVVTFTTGATNTNQRITHSLGSVPGCIIVKRTDGVDNWFVWHRSLASTTDSYLYLNTTAVSQNTGGAWGATGPTATDFGIDDNFFGGGRACVAYIFAHNAGGFGLTGTDNVISCGSFTTNGSAVSGQIDLGYEPQWLLIKCSSAAGNWMLVDNMRGVTATGNGATGLYANTTAAEDPSRSVNINATGFSVSGDFGISATSIYIAIRRGPMKVPTSGTSVFAPVLTTTNNTITTNFPVDLSIFRADRGTTASNFVFDRLRGKTARMVTSTTGAEATATAYPSFDNNTGTALTGFTSGLLGVDWAFRRAPGFFDEVCYTGTGTGNPISHNLTVKPTLLISKSRSNADSWEVAFLDTNTNTYRVGTDAATQFAVNSTNGWGTTQRPAGYTGPVDYTPVLFWDKDTSGRTYVTYLFATCAGVSKVGSYTGNGSSQTINCGFTSGARFILIKRTDAASPWYVWDTARGIVAGNDPYLLLNSSVAEVQGYDDVDTASTGFIVNYYVGGATDINTSGGTYIFLAIA